MAQTPQKWCFIAADRETDNNNTVYIYSIIVICFSVGSDEAPLLWCLGHILYLRLLP